MDDCRGHIKLLDSPHYGAGGLLVCRTTCNDLRFSQLSRVRGAAVEAEHVLSRRAAAASLQLVAFDDLWKEQEETQKCATERRLEIETWENTQSEANSGLGDDDDDDGSALGNGDLEENEDEANGHQEEDNADDDIIDGKLQDEDIAGDDGPGQANNGKGEGYGADDDLNSLPCREFDSNAAQSLISRDRVQ
jgi:hypothetical protein